jgi:hypothetical protein
VRALSPELERRQQAAVSWMSDRREDGHVRECHGDLHAGNIVRLESRLAPRRPVLVLVSGLSGSGKTWLADRIAPALGAIHIRSDVERKRLAGLAEGSRSGAPVGEGLYSRDFSKRVYDAWPVRLRTSWQEAALRSSMRHSPDARIDASLESSRGG